MISPYYDSSVRYYNHRALFFCLDDMTDGNSSNQTIVEITFYFW